jgi:hypothetical protein
MLRLSTEEIWRIFLRTFSALVISRARGNPGLLSGPMSLDTRFRGYDGILPLVSIPDSSFERFSSHGCGYVAVLCVGFVLGFLIPNFSILERKVLELIPSKSAAPFLP